MSNKQFKENGGCNNLRKFITKFDLKTEPFNFYLPDGNTRLKAVLGGLTFIFFACIFAIFILNNLIAFSDRAYYNILNFKENNSSHNGANDKISSE